MDGWAEPLLDRIRSDPSNVVCPLIDTIWDDTFQYHANSARGMQVGGFTWNLIFSWHLDPEKD